MQIKDDITIPKLVRATRKIICYTEFINHFAISDQEIHLHITHSETNAPNWSVLDT